jgi:hypothetical protein
VKYRKKPVVIDAVQLTREVIEAYLWDGGALPDGVRLSHSSHHPGRREVYQFRAHIKTLEGDMECREGDWIIRGVKGELYPCKPDIFEATYEAVAP